MNQSDFDEIYKKLWDLHSFVSTIADANDNRPQVRLMFRRGAAKIEEAFGFIEAGASFGYAPKKPIEMPPLSTTPPDQEPLKDTKES